MLSLISKLRVFYFTTGFAGGLITPYLSVWFVQDGLKANQIGFITSIGTLVAILFQPVWGMIVDRFRMTRLTLALTCFIPAGLALFYNSRVLFIIALANALYNVFSIPQSPLSDAYAIASAKDRGVSYSTIRLFASLGFSIAGYIGGLYLTHFSVSTLWMPFAFASLASGFLVCFFPKSGTTNAANRKPSKSGLLELLKNRKFLMFLIGGFLVSQTLTAFNTYFALTFRAIGGSMALTGLAFMVASFTNVPSMFFSSWVIRRFGFERTMMIASFAYVIRWGVQVLFPNPLVSILVQVLHGISFGFYYIAAVGFVSQTARKELQATAQSIFGMVCGGVAGMVGNLLNGYLLHIGGASLMYGACTISSIFAGVCFWYVSKANVVTNVVTASKPL